MCEIQVNLGERSYVVTVGPGVLATVGAIVSSVRRPGSAAVVSNPLVARYHVAAVMDSLASAGIRAELIVMPAGERFKTLRTVRRIYDALLAMNMDRGGAVVAVGGGVIGDTAGFAAATYMRGIDFYQVPTTVLAQVDASVGGKTGVDLPQGKNLVGAFHQPRAVLIDTMTLMTLPARELRSGLAEVVKHGIIYDQAFHGYVKSHASDLLARDEQALREVVRRSVEIKRDVVESDEKESGVRAILNYGHTVGHAIESLSGYGKYRHGEASSIGMVTEGILAEAEGIAEVGVADEVARTLRKMRLPVEMAPSLSTEEMVRAIGVDKKIMGGQLRLALPVRIGECGVFAIGRDAVARAIDTHRKRTW